MTATCKVSIFDEASAYADAIQELLIDHTAIASLDKAIIPAAKEIKIQFIQKENQPDTNPNVA
jgi:hypothetical protein